jgi:hypothetical protein
MEQFTAAVSSVIRTTHSGDVGTQTIDIETSGSAKTKRCHPSDRAGALVITQNRTARRFIACAFLSPLSLLVTFAFATTSPDSSSQEKEKKPPALRWDPPQVDTPLRSISVTPPCSLPDVLKQSGQRALELVDHLQNFAAHEQIRYEQTDRTGISGISIAAQFDYVVDFGQRVAGLGPDFLPNHSRRL